MVTIDDLVETIDDPDDDSTRAYQLVAQLTAARDVGLVPALVEHLVRFLDEGHFYGRDVIADTLAGIAGTGALQVLLVASARDLGDDQDSLSSTILELLHADPAGSRIVLAGLLDSPDPRLRSTAAWAASFLDQG